MSLYNGMSYLRLENHYDEIRRLNKNIRRIKHYDEIRRINFKMSENFRVLYVDPSYDYNDILIDGLYKKEVNILYMNEMLKQYEFISQDNRLAIIKSGFHLLDEMNDDMWDVIKYNYFEEYDLDLQITIEQCVKDQIENKIMFK
tara:strand:+ start:5763 stop:6194 length:432 start_codon:yes stop_codon:yes gene_type:complete